MRIDNWPINKIMELPDWCFGRRFVIGLHVDVEADVPSWDISEIALPEVFVLWEVAVWSRFTPERPEYFRLALGTELPTAVAQMDALTPLLAGVGRQGPDPRRIDVGFYIQPALRMLRIPFHSGGRKAVLEAVGYAAQTSNLQAVLTISSAPKEVMDWLVLGPDKKQL